MNNCFSDDLLNNRTFFNFKKGKFVLLVILGFISSTLFAQQKTISGRVLSGDTAVAGVTVQVKGTKTATQTNSSGNFTINAPANATLVISSIGYTMQEVKTNNRSSINVQLQSSAQEMQQVVVVGYGTQKKATLTGSVSTVKGTEVSKSPTMNVSNSLGGRLPGLVTVTPSGEPGADGSILRIRGVNTLGNNNPLIVVDGIPGRSLDRIDPSTIESISVLKDASAAIYGAQAANGVILITTKRGKTGKPTVTASFNQGYGRPTRIPKMADAATYATMLNEINEYAGRAPKFTAEDIKKYQDGSDPWGHPNTDWFKEVLRPWSGQNYANISINGGNEAVKYFVSLSKKGQEGYYKNSGTKYNQYDFRSNLDANVSKNISLSFDVAGRMEDRNFPTRSAGSIFRMVMRGKPNETAYWPNGTPGPDIEYGDNPVVVSTKATGYDHDKLYVLNSNAKLNVKIPWIEGLSFTGNAAIDKGFDFHKLWQTPWFLYSWNGVDRDASGQPVLQKSQKGFSSPALTENSQDNQNILLNGLLNYETKVFNDHNIKFLIGAERITGKGDNFSAYRRNFISSILDQMFAGAQDQYLTNNGSAYRQARLNYFGRVNYNYKEKYLAEFVWRYQGSYIFPEAKRFGFFPGVSLGYRISDEDFWKESLSFINTFKLRASWGRTGNDQIPEWQYLSTYGIGGIRPNSWNPPLPFVTNGNVENPALYETLVPNPNATWETADQGNIGFDATLLKNRLSVTADYFQYKRSDILLARNASIPTTAGFTPPRENIARVSNRGFDFGINYNNTVGKLSYQIGLNGGYQKNRIDFWDEPAGLPDYQKSTGYPIGSTLYYKAIGIYRDSASVSKTAHLDGARAGDVIFADINGDGIIDDFDRIRIQKSDLPTFTGGLTLGVQYRGFDFSALVQGAAGGVRYISTESGEIGNFLQSYATDRWTSQNPDASGPRTFNRSNEYWVGRGNTFWLHKTDYVRLKNIEIGYNLPPSVVRRLGIQNLRVYINAYNLLTYSPDLKDFDPELTSPTGGATGSNVSTGGQSYPLQKIINGGLSITF
ncbi:SusC/RagA family TonB-linked outer membrane protein [Segetibacter koreensis]|uniref:SusC/RagA family TonB-linked outer membrane protein n=1 Tax=Segetibacter koreensis TaxID=398037 RepID=UPI00037616B8|nr:TonB-dependent receptor [Segetibacter koreensis]